MIQNEMIINLVLATISSNSNIYYTSLYKVQKQILRHINLNFDRMSSSVLLTCPNMVKYGQRIQALFA